MCVISGAMGLASGIQGSESAKKRGKFEQAYANYNAAQTKMSGDLEAVKMGIKQRREFGAMVAGASAGNRDISFGSTFRILEETMRFDAFDHLLHARTVKAKVTEHRVAGQAAMFNASVAANDALMGGVAALMGGVEGGISAGLAGIKSGLLPNPFKGINFGGGAAAPAADSMSRRAARYGRVVDPARYMSN